MEVLLRHGRATFSKMQELLAILPGLILIEVPIVIEIVLVVSVMQKFSGLVLLFVRRNRLGPSFNRC